MFDPNIIDQISKQSKAEKWPYPKTFEALKKAGVDSYEVRFDTFQIRYHGDGQEWIEPFSGPLPSFEVSQRLAKEGVKEAILHHIQFQTFYADFLKEIAAAGVSFYEVDMANRTVTYWGEQKDVCHVEKVPTWG